MPQLLISVEPGVFNTSDGILQAGQLATDELFLKLSHISKFACVRAECFNMGYMGDGDQPPLPLSPVDYAALEQLECLFIPVYASTGNPASGLIPGQVAFPALDPFHIGRPLVMPYEHFYDVNAKTLVEELYAFQTSDTDSHVFQWGTGLVFCISQRLGILFQATTQLAKDMIFTLSGSTSVNGSNFNGAYVVNSIWDQQNFEYFQPQYDYPNCFNDAGGGGTITFGAPTMTAPVAASPFGLKRYNTGKPGCGLVVISLASPPVQA